MYEPTKKTVTWAILTAAGSLCAFIVFLFVMTSGVKNTEEEILKTKNITGGVEQAFKIKAELNEFSEEINTVNSFFVEPGGEVSLIEKIESMATSSGIKMVISSVSVDPKSAAGFKEDMRLNLLAEGKQKNVLAFFKSLENMPLAVVVDRVSLKSVADGSLWSLDAGLTVYKIRSPKK